MFLSTANAANNQWLGYEEDMHATCPTVGAIDVLQALVPGNGATISNLALRGGGLELLRDAAPGGRGAGPRVGRRPGRDWLPGYWYPASMATGKFVVEMERETDRRWVAEVVALPGVLAYGANREEALAKAEVLALRVLADRLEHGEAIPEITGLFDAA